MVALSHNEEQNFCAAFVVNEIRHHIFIKGPGEKHREGWLISSSPSSGCHFNRGKQWSAGAVMCKILLWAKRNPPYV